MFKQKEPNSDRTIDLDGQSGNAYAIMGTVNRMVRQLDPDRNIDELNNEMTSGDYIHLLQVANREIGMIVTFTSNDPNLIEQLNQDPNEII